jgi:hypothetical protein
MIKELIKILSNSSKEIKTWQTKYYNIFRDKKRSLTPYENLWNVFNTAVSSIDLFTEQNDKIVQKLQYIQDSIPSEKNNQSLKDKIQQIESTSKKLYEEITDLANQERKLGAKINRQRTGSCCNTLRKNVFRTDENKPKEKLKVVLRSIKNKKESYKSEKQTFYQEAAYIIEENTKTELRLTLSMKQKFDKFVKSFDIYPKQFKRALERCDPQKDLDEWKQNILYRNAEQSFESSDEDHDENTNRHRKFVKSRSIERENSDGKTNRHLKSIKSESTENNRIDEKICQPLESVKSRSIENENCDNKKTIRQSSLRSSSVVDKNRAKKIKTPKQSLEFQPVNSDDTDDKN